VAQCPSTSKMVKYIDRSVECRECADNQHYNSTGQCVCDDGFVKNSTTGQCDKAETKVAAPAVTMARTSKGDSLDDEPQQLPEGCLKVVSLQQSNKNIFVTFQASQTIFQDQDSSESGFLKVTFPDTQTPVSYYCNRCPQDDSLFECLLLFATGLPSQLFTMRFGCKVAAASGAKTCQLEVPYRPLEKTT
jgi:hypothetical protein